MIEILLGKSAKLIEWMIIHEKWTQEVKIMSKQLHLSKRYIRKMMKLYIDIGLVTKEGEDQYKINPVSKLLPHFRSIMFQVSEYWSIVKFKQYSRLQMGINDEAKK